MKKLFCGIGILLGIFSIYFFLLFADKIVYVNDSTIFEFELANSIEYQQLEEMAKAADIMVQLRNYEEVDFGNVKLRVQLVNPEKNIVEGVQKSVFPNTQIIYETKNYLQDIKIQRFIIQEDNREKIEAVERWLADNKYEFEIREEEPAKFTLLHLFSVLNLEFYILIMILATLCIVTYYVYRLKEIGVLKLNGWSNFRISWKIAQDMMKYTIISAGILMLAADIYILSTDSSVLGLYAKICALLMLFICGVYGIASVIATLFIKNMNQVNAIKNGKNTRTIFYSLIVAKTITTFLLLLGMNQLYQEIILADDCLSAARELENCNFYTMITSVSLEEGIDQLVDKELQELSENEIFNYGYSDQSYNKLALKGKRIQNGVYNYQIISENMLSKMKIMDIQGQPIESLELLPGEEKLLVPEHYKEEIPQMLEDIGIPKTSDIYYIKDGQIYPDMLQPGQYAFDTIFLVTETQKSIHWAAGELLLTEEAGKKIEEKLIQKNIDSGSVQVVSKNTDIQVVMSNERIILWERGFFFVINIISYILSSISIIVIYFEFKKKQFGVYTLVGRVPVKEILTLAIINTVILVMLAVIINTKFLLLIIFELIFYLINVNVYLRKKAIFAIKGE